MSASTKNRYESTAEEALALLERLEEVLAPDSDLQPRDRKHSGALRRISADAMDAAARIAERGDGRFVDFPIEQVRDAVEYERAMTTVLARAQTLVARLSTSMLKRRHAPACETLALYATVKGMARLRAQFYDDATELGDLVAPHRIRRRAEHVDAAERAVRP